MAILTQAETDFVQVNLHADISDLALKMERYPILNAGLVLKQLAGFQAIEHKIPSWYGRSDLSFPSSLPLEQCSSEVTALYKAKIVSELADIHSLADLTGGFGVDCCFMSRGLDRVLYVERQPELCEVAEHNFKVLGLPQIQVRQGDGWDAILELSANLKKKPFDLIFIDPARRNTKGEKVVALSDCEPDITQIKDLLLANANYVLVKLSPMLDISLALKSLPETIAVHVVSVNGECKELLFLLKEKGFEPEIHCVNLRSAGSDQFFIFKKSAEQSAKCSYTENPGTYLYEPNVSLLKAGAFSLLSQSFNLFKLHPNSHLYTSDQLCMDFPGRVFQVESVFQFHSKEWKEQLKNVFKANITVRNFPNTVNEIRKKTGLREGGDIYLFATTLNDGRKVLIRCKKV